MTERRYDEEEVAAIFRQATEAQQPQRAALAPAEGMTLAELQEIGREVGIAAESVAEAARALSRRATPTTRRFLGMPIGVGRTVDLHRKVSDAEWEQIVVDLRETFDARGRLKQEGSFRQWTNGNLQALLEPVPTGHRLRIKTVNANARGWMMGGIAAMTAAAATAIGGFAGGASNMNLAPIFEMGLIGAGLFAIGALRVPRWAQLRQRQMMEILARVAAGPTKPPTDNQ